MEYEQYIGLKKGKARTLEKLYQESLKRSWFCVIR